MAKIKVAEATGRVLDYLVAIAKGVDPQDIRVDRDRLYRWMRDADGRHTGAYMTGPEFMFSSMWESGGPIIERERMAVTCTPVYWCAYRHSGVRRHDGFETYAWTHKHVGPTPLIAAMRCYVASKLGEEVEVPDALLEP